MSTRYLCDICGVIVEPGIMLSDHTELYNEKSNIPQLDGNNDVNTVTIPPSPRIAQPI